MSVEIIESSTTDKTETYPTTNVGQAAALLTRKHKLMEVRLRKTKRGQSLVEFVFERSNIQQDVTAWINNDLLVEPRAFLRTHEDLRDIIRSKSFLKKEKVDDDTAPVSS